MEGEAVLAPLTGHPAALGDLVQRRPYTEAQSFLDQTYSKGARNYWGATNYAAISDDLIREVVDLTKTLPTAESDILFIAQGGAIDDVPVDATAYPHRNVAFMSAQGARWRDAADDGRMVAGSRIAHHALAGMVDKAPTSTSSANVRVARVMPTQRTTSG